MPTATKVPKRLMRLVPQWVDNTVAITPPDLELFKLLDPLYGFKVLTTEWMVYFRPASHNHMQHRFTTMFNHPYRYLDRPDKQQNFTNYFYKSLIYSRGDKAAEMIGDSNKKSFRSGSLAHELYVDVGFYAPMRFALAERPDVQLFDARTLSHHPNTPAQASAEAKDPYTLQIADKKDTNFDGAPFVLQKRDRIVCVPGIQADRNTEGSGNRLKGSRRSMGGHIDEIHAFMEKQMYRTHFGFQKRASIVFPLIFTSHGRMKKHMIDVAKDRGACPYLLFKHIPDIADALTHPAPSGDNFATAWHRVGHSEFDFLNLDK